MVGLNEHPSPGAGNPSREQFRYARLLDWGMKTGLVVLIVGFIAYVSGVLPPLIPLEALPRLWTLPVADYVRESGMATGWGWLAMPGKGDVVITTGIAILAGISLPCLAALVPVYARRRDWPFLVVTLTLIGVLMLAASGVLVAH
jgi:hypothetical protein